MFKLKTKADGFEEKKLKVCATNSSSYQVRNTNVDSVQVTQNSIKNKEVILQNKPKQSIAAYDDRKQVKDLSTLNSNDINEIINIVENPLPSICNTEENIVDLKPVRSSKKPQPIVNQPEEIENNHVIKTQEKLLLNNKGEIQDVSVQKDNIFMSNNKLFNNNTKGTPNHKLVSEPMSKKSTMIEEIKPYNQKEEQFIDMKNIVYSKKKPDSRNTTLVNYNSNNHSQVSNWGDKQQSEKSYTNSILSRQASIANSNMIMSPNKDLKKSNADTNAKDNGSRNIDMKLEFSEIDNFSSNANKEPIVTEYNNEPKMEISSVNNSLLMSNDGLNSSNIRIKPVIKKSNKFPGQKSEKLINKEISSNNSIKSELNTDKLFSDKTCIDNKVIINNSPNETVLTNNKAPCHEINIKQEINSKESCGNVSNLQPIDSNIVLITINSETSGLINLPANEEEFLPKAKSKALKSKPKKIKAQEEQNISKQDQIKHQPIHANKNIIDDNHLINKIENNSNTEKFEWEKLPHKPLKNDETTHLFNNNNNFHKENDDLAYKGIISKPQDRSSPNIDYIQETSKRESNVHNEKSFIQDINLNENKINLRVNLASFENEKMQKEIISFEGNNLASPVEGKNQPKIEIDGPSRKNHSPKEDIPKDKLFIDSKTGIIVDPNSIKNRVILNKLVNSEHKNEEEEVSNNNSLDIDVLKSYRHDNELLENTMNYRPEIGGDHEEEFSPGHLQNHHFDESEINNDPEENNPEEENEMMEEYEHAEENGEEIEDDDVYNQDVNNQEMEEIENDEIENEEMSNNGQDEEDGTVQLHEVIDENSEDNNKSEDNISEIQEEEEEMIYEKTDPKEEKLTEIIQTPHSKNSPTKFDLPMGQLTIEDIPIIKHIPEINPFKINNTNKSVNLTSTLGKDRYDNSSSDSGNESIENNENNENNQYNENGEKEIEQEDRKTAEKKLGTGYEVFKRKRRQKSETFTTKLVKSISSSASLNNLFRSQIIGDNSDEIEIGVDYSLLKDVSLHSKPMTSQQLKIFHIKNNEKQILKEKNEVIPNENSDTVQFSTLSENNNTNRGNDDFRNKMDPLDMSPVGRKKIESSASLFGTIRVPSNLNTNENESPTRLVTIEDLITSKIKEYKLTNPEVPPDEEENLRGKLINHLEQFKLTNVKEKLDTLFVRYNKFGNLSPSEQVNFFYFIILFLVFISSS